MYVTFFGADESILNFFRFDYRYTGIYGEAINEVIFGFYIAVRNTLIHANITSKSLFD